MALPLHQDGSGNGMCKVISQTEFCLRASPVYAVAVMEPGRKEAEEIYWSGLLLGLHTGYSGDHNQFDIIEISAKRASI